jgi:plasmid maintenance system killer protein
MEISYSNKKLAKLLNSQKEVLRTYGPDNGRRILARLADIAAAETLADLSTLPQTRVHEHKANNDEQISVDVKHPYRLMLVPNHSETPRKSDNGLDWSKITRVKILRIDDPH